MRGEETLLFGAISNGAKDGVFCVPGTHSKWCRIENGNLFTWQTVMTGELFALLSTESTLSEFCGGIRTKLYETPAFESAVLEVLHEPTSAIHKLFSIRARALLDPEADQRDFSSRLSGLLIGQEIAGINWDTSALVSLIASGPLAEAYCSALMIAGRDTAIIEADASALAGLSLFAQQLNTHNAKVPQS
jgi:2-dehydro-3-deoxygalactonokinase